MDKEIIKGQVRVMEKCEMCGKKTKDLYGTQKDLCWDCYLDYSDFLALQEF